MPEIDNIPDVSEWQGSINWSAVPAPIALMKVSDGSTYFDKQANNNYYAAKAAGKAVGMYHFSEWTDPTAEANHFLAAVSPLEQFDVLILDIEAIKVADPVSWTLTFINRVHDQTGVWPMVYMSLSTVNAYNWGPVLLTCGLWIADWNNNPSGTIPTNHVYVMQQYTDAGSIPGIAGRVDEDAWYGTVDQFRAYGYHAPAAPTPPAPPTPPTPPVITPPTPPTPPVIVPPTPPTPPTPPVITPPVPPVPPTLPDPATIPDPVLPAPGTVFPPDPSPNDLPMPGPAPQPPKKSLWQKILDIFGAILDFIKG